MTKGSIQCVVELYTWNLYNFVNQCHSNKFSKKGKQRKKVVCSYHKKLLSKKGETTDICINSKELKGIMLIGEKTISKIYILYSFISITFSKWQNQSAREKISIGENVRWLRGKTRKFLGGDGRVWWLFI